ncbi:hypothetical protein SynA18461_00502 [Synechococcus sp. A18-46.1]|nr:hypothetical protein SynA18461_00502 [Synechococcus sp. A18-46.1]
MPAVDQAYLRGVQAGLTEWGSDADEGPLPTCERRSSV